VSQGTDLRIAVSRGDDPTEGFIGLKIPLHNVKDAGGEGPMLGYNGSGVFIVSVDYPPDFSAPTGFSLVVLPKSDLLAASLGSIAGPSSNIPIPAAGEWIVPAIDLDGSKRDEIVLSTEASFNTPLARTSAMTSAAHLEPRLDLGSGFPDKYFFGRAITTISSMRAARSTACR